MIIPFMSLQLDLTVNERLTYAQLINGRAKPVASLRVINQGTSPKDLIIRPAIGDLPLEDKKAPRIQSCESRDIDVSDWILPADFPYPETGSRVAVLRLALNGRDGKNKETKVQTVNITLSPRNMMCTFAREADLIAAHVTPDCDALREITGEAIRKSGQDARAMLRELYEAVRARRLPYQPVGMVCDPGYQAAFNALHTLAHGGSCADMSLMFASLMRTAGLAPVLFMKEEHMLAGCWLTPNRFERTVVTDVKEILAPIRSGDLVAVECTDACDTPSRSFEEACADAVSLLCAADCYPIAIDVWRALSQEAPRVECIPLPCDRPEPSVQMPKAVLHACPHCGNTHFSPEELAKAIVYCPACGVTFTPAGRLPVRDEAPAEPDPPEEEPEAPTTDLPPVPIEISATEMVCSVRGATAVVTGGSKKAARLAARAQFQGKPVTAVAPNALSGAAMEEVILADSIRTIGDRAFHRCTGLRRVALPASLEKLGLSAFAGCTALEQVSIPGTLRCIPRMAFSGCTSLKEIVIEEGVEIVDAYAFSGCTSLESVTLPASVRTVAARAFGDCTALREVRLMSDSTRVDTAAFAGCKLL